MNKNKELKQKIIQQLQHVEDEKLLKYLYTLLCEKIARQSK